MFSKNIVKLSRKVLLAFTWLDVAEIIRMQTCPEHSH